MTFAYEKNIYTIESSSYDLYNQKRVLIKINQY